VVVEVSTVLGALYEFVGVAFDERWLQKYKPPRIITAKMTIVATTGPTELSWFGIVVKS
jgi:hypothetical protein